MAKQASNRTPAPKGRIIVGICAALVAITWIVFGQTLGHQFVTYDDPEYVYSNPDIVRGLSLAGIVWAFTHNVAGNWHPLTVISHMLDCQLYGLKPAGHHFTNILLHTVAVVLLFLVLRQMTGALWRSALVAALFAIHPLHVESVAWISERKDVLSAAFFMLTLGAYIRYVRAPSPIGYLLVVFLFALGLMSKPILVTVPFVLLLLDYWPLSRFSAPGFAKARGKPVIGNQWAIVSRLITEKIPLLGLSAVSSVITWLTHLQTAGSKYQLPFTWRFNNALVSYVAYVWQMFWPVRLAAFYPHPNDQLAVWQVLLAIAFLIAITLLAIHWRKERPYVFTGWFWYVGMLVPVIGLVVQVGEQAHADRYTYLPQIGLYILIVWGVPDLILAVTGRERDRSRAYALLCAATSATIVILLSWRAFMQTSYWKNSEVLWNHALAVTGDNDVAHNNLGNLFLQRRELDSARWHFETALNIRARTTAPYYNSGGALIENSLAAILDQRGLIDESTTHYDKAISMRPDYGDPYLNLGNLLFKQGRTDDAMAQWEKALGTQPHDAAFHVLLGDAFLRAGSEKVAIAEYERAARISAQDPISRNNLAWLLATSSDASIRDGDRATRFAEEAVRLSHGKDPNYLRTLAAAYAESGRFDDANETARRGLQLAETQHNSTLINALRDEIALYELGLAYHN